MTKPGNWPAASKPNGAEPAPALSLVAGTSAPPGIEAVPAGPQGGLMPLAATAKLNIGYCRVLLNHLESHGSAQAVQALAPALRAHLDQPDPFACCSLQEWQSLMQACEQALGDPMLALKLAQSVQLWHIGVVGYLLMTSASLRDVGNVLRRFQHLLNSGCRVEPYQGDTHFRLRLVAAPHAACNRLALMMLGSWACRARWLTGREDQKFDATFEAPAPADPRAVARLFGGKVLFGQEETGLLGHVGYLDLPVIQQNPGVNSVLRTQALAQLERLAQESNGFLAHIERFIKDRLDRGRVSLEEAAAELGMSARTLQMRLEEYGITFRALLDGVRSSQARHLLADARLSLTEVALMLGFADQATFSHAFRRWAAVSPGEWRKRQAALGR
jgi:AraC-like DNA-binding protein